MIASTSHGSGRLTHPPAERTEAQKAASRANGRKGRGPASAEGRAKSARNSYRHGLLARKFSPPADYREDDRLYRRIRRRLLAEFRPDGFVEHAAIDGLAGDFVLLARARQLVEAFMRPPALAERDEELWTVLRRVRRELPGLRRLQSALNAGDPLANAQQQAERLARLLTDSLASIERDIEEAGEPDPEADDEEERVLAELLGDLGMPGRRRLSDRSYLEGILRGSRPKRGDLKRLRALLNYSVRCREQWVAYPGQEVAKKAGELTDRAINGLAAEPEKLGLLQRYVGEIERRIERKVRDLRGS